MSGAFYMLPCHAPLSCLSLWIQAPRTLFFTPLPLPPPPHFFPPCLLPKGEEEFTEFPICLLRHVPLHPLRENGALHAVLTPSPRLRGDGHYCLENAQSHLNGRMAYDVLPLCQFFLVLERTRLQGNHLLAFGSRLCVP